jgi:hypothetical protein
MATVAFYGEQAVQLPEEFISIVKQYILHVRAASFDAAVSDGVRNSAEATLFVAPASGRRIQKMSGYVTRFFERTLQLRLTVTRLRQVGGGGRGARTTTPHQWLTAPLLLPPCCRCCTPLLPRRVHLPR